MATRAGLPPELLDWWLLLRRLPEDLHRVHRWTADGHPPDLHSAGHLHATATHITCLQGVVRVTYREEHLDLQAGEALVIAAGAWHLHQRLRGDGVLFQQGVRGGRSDFWLGDRHERLFGTVPAEPSHRLMEAAVAAADPQRRRELFRELVRNFNRETIEPLRDQRPEVDRMEQALWRYMSSPGSAEDVIRAAGISRAQAYRRFVEHFGQPPGRVLLGMRLDHARGLLRQGIAVAEVASRCGFASRQAFTRAFARELGVAPARWGSGAGGR